MPHFAVLQSRVHEVWATLLRIIDERSICATRRPTASRPSPSPRTSRRTSVSKPSARHTTNSAPQLMIDQQRGPDEDLQPLPRPDERSPDILKLRELHAAMDRAVLDAYGWTDLAAHLRIPARLRGGRGRRRQPRRAAEEALALPLARRLPRRSARPPAGTEQTARRTGTPGRTGSRSRHRHVPGTQEAVQHRDVTAQAVGPEHGTTGPAGQVKAVARNVDHAHYCPQETPGVLGQAFGCRSCGPGIR